MENRDAGLRITFPVRASRRNLFMLAGGLLIWAYAEISAFAAFMTGHVPEGTRFMINGVDSQSSGDPDFMTKWLIGWSAMGLFFAGMFLVFLAGREIIELDTTWLKRRKLILGFGRSREYRVAHITDLGPAPTPMMAAYLWNFPLNFDTGAICFDYGRDTHFLGAGLTEAERLAIISALRKWIQPPDKES
jgi:hypothetical protein